MTWEVRAYLPKEEGTTIVVGKYSTEQEAELKMKEIMKEGFYIKRESPKSTVFYPAKLIRKAEIMEIEERNA